MPTSKNANIQDFFKPFAKPRLNKRPPSDDMIDGSRVNQRSQSSMPDMLISTEPNVTSNSPSKQMRLPIVSDKVEGIVYNLTNGSLSTGQGLVNGESRQHGEVSRKEETERVGSEGPVLTSSQRVIRNGEVMIRNSDDESGSDVSLDDIDDLLVARKTATVSPPLTETEISCPAEVEHVKEGTKIVTRSKTRGSRRAQASLAKSILPGLPKYIFSLDSLEERSNADKELEEGTARAKLLLKSLEHSNGPSAEKAQKSSKNESRVDAGLVMTVMKDKNDEEGISRLMTAIQRTEAFDQGKTWSFFSRSKDPTLLEQVAFPAIQDLKWRDILVGPFS